MLRRAAHIVPLALAAASLAAAQESAALFDAPVVEVDEGNRIEHLVELDGAPGYEALTWWWRQKTRDQIYVRAWSIDPDTGFEFLWEKVLDNPTNLLTNVRLLPGDLNGDGLDDVVVVVGATLYVFTGNGTSAPTQIQTWTNARVVEQGWLADFDGDGDDDMLLVDEVDSASLYENGGSAQGWQLTYTQNPKNLGLVFSNRYRLDELTGDGAPDLFFVRDDALVIQPIAPDLSFPAEVTFTTATPTYLPIPTSGDIDGDGDVDAVVFARDEPTYDPQYTVLRRTGPATFSLEAPAAGGPATDLVDLDGDGDLDGACCGGGGSPSNPIGWLNIYSATFELCHNDGTGAFTTAFQLRGQGATRLAGAADVDFDGDVDLVAGRVVYYPPAPISGPFNAPIHYSEHQVGLLKDADGDGDPDVRLTVDEVRTSNGTGWTTSVAPVVQAAPPGEEYKGPGYSGDFDGDGDVDLIVARWSAGQFAAMCLLANDGGGHFTDAGDAAASGVLMSHTGDADIDPRGSVAVDVDGDHDDDLFLWKSTFSTSSSSSLWLNDGDGFFTASTAEFYGDRPLAFEDFDGDGNVDFLTRYGDSQSTGKNVRIWLGDGAGGYTSGFLLNPTTIWVKGEYGAVAADDFDADGDIDLALYDQPYSSQTYTFLLQNDGNANFTFSQLPVEAPAYNSSAARVLAHDVNGDGWSDLLFIGPRTGSTNSVIMLRNPDGVLFAAPFEQTVLPYDAGDVDGDGDLDLVDGGFYNYLFVPDRLVANRTHEGPQAGIRYQEGAGSPGTGGLTPILGATGPFRVGESAALRLCGARPATSGYLDVYDVAPQLEGAASGPASGRGAGTHEMLIKSIAFTTSGLPTDPPGTGSWTLPFQVPRVKAGRTIKYQVRLDDPAAVGGTARTNRLYILYGD